MASRNPSFFRRIGLAFSVLFGAELAGRLVRMRDEAAAADAVARSTPRGKRCFTDLSLST